MTIYALFQGLSAGSNVSAPLSPDWFPVLSLSWGVRQTSAPRASEHSSATNEFEDMVLTRKSDALTQTLAMRAMSGEALGVVLIAVIDEESKKCVSGYKLDGASLRSWSIVGDSSGATQEHLAIAYRNIAQVMLVAGQLQLATWDRNVNAPWNDAARSFYIDPKWGIRIR